MEGNGVFACEVKLSWWKILTSNIFLVARLKLPDELLRPTQDSTIETPQEFNKIHQNNKQNVSLI